MVGDRVRRLSQVETTLHDADGNENAWNLLPEEVAVVVEVDKDGDVRLCNPTGLESGFTFRRDYGYVKEDETLKACVLANQAAAFALQSACLAQESIFMRMQQGHLPYGMEDPGGYMTNPWALPNPTCPPMYADPASTRGWLASKLTPKASRKGKKSSMSDASTAAAASLGTASWASAGTASCGTASWGTDGTASLFSSLSSFDEEAQKGAGALAHTLPHERTTVMMRNIPNNCTREQLITLIEENGFQSCFDLVYLPIDLKNKVGLGYAFLNFRSNEDANAFILSFQGFKNWNMKSEKICEVTWSDAMQGLSEHVERYRDSPVMHDSVPEEFKPVLFKDGQRVKFPPPTRKLRAPRPWSRRH